MKLVLIFSVIALTAVTTVAGRVLRGDLDVMLEEFYNVVLSGDQTYNNAVYLDPLSCEDVLSTTAQPTTLLPDTTLTPSTTDAPAESDNAALLREFTEWMRQRLGF